MSSWSEIRSRTTDPLSSTINSLILRQNQANAITDEIQDSETIFPVRILNSKISMSDHDLTTGYAKPLSQAFYMPFEPDGKVVKLWTRFDSGGVSVTDYSHFGNNIEVRSSDPSAPQPDLLMTAEDDGVSNNKISSHLEKTKKHYFRVTDPKFNLATENSSFTFFFKIYPTLINNVENNGKRAVLMDYIEDDQVRNAVRVELDDDGYVYFLVRWNHLDYYVKSDSPLFSFPDFPDYYAQDYDEQDFYASEADDPPFVLPLEFQYIFCTFNKLTRVATILHPTSDTTCETWLSDAFPIMPQSANLSLWLPMQEGGGETPPDISGLANNSSFSAIDAARKPYWITVASRRFLEFGERDYLTIPKTTSLNTFTTGFTISLFLYLHSDYYSIAHSKILFANASSGNGRFTLYTPTTTGRTVQLDVVNDVGTSRFLGSGGTPLPASAGVWTHIVVTYDGSTYKFYVDKVQTPTTHSHSGDEFTNAQGLFAGSFSDNFGGHSNIAHLMVWKNVALSAAEIETLYDTLYPRFIDTFDNSTGLLLDDSKPLFPPYYPEPPAPPEPGTPITLPFTQTQYSQQSGTSYAAVKPVTVSGLTTVYNVPGGAPVTDPVSVVYNVPEGVETGGGTIDFTEVYNCVDPDNNSFVQLSSGEDNATAAIEVSASNSALIGKQITKAIFYMKSENSPVGNLRCRVWNSSNTLVTTLGTMSASSVNGSTMTAYTFTNTDLGPWGSSTMQIGWKIGIQYDEGTNSNHKINVKRNTSDPKSGEKQAVRDYDGSWSSNLSNDIVGNLYTGGTGSPTVSPYITINTSSQYIIAQYFNSTSTVANKAPTKIELKVKKKSGTTGTLFLQILSNSGTTLKKSLKSWNIGTEIGTTDPAGLNLVWEDLTNTTTIATNDRLILGGGGTLSSGGEVYVMSNLGNNTIGDATKNHNSTSSYILKRSSGGAWTTYNANTDLTGKITVGGNDFSGYIELDNTRKRTGVRANTASSTLVGKKISKVTATLKKVGTPASGAIYCRIRNAAGTERVTINQVDISSVGSSDTSVDFINTIHNITMATGDTISLEYDLGTASDYVAVRISKGIHEITNTVLFESFAGASINTANPLNDRDWAGILYTGGQTDGTARPRVGLIVNNSNSSLWGRAITKIRLWLKREGSSFAGGDQMSVKIIRGSDKAVVSTLGTKAILDLNPTTGTAYDFENIGNTYVMADGDMIVVENLHGNATNYIWVKKSTTDVIDSTSTCLVEWNSTAYTISTDQDLNGIAWTGGYTVYPDPSIPQATTPYHYSHEIFFGAATTPDSEGSILPSELEPDPETMFSFIAADFRVYVGRLVIEDESINIFRNKYSISPINYGEIKTVAHSTVAANPP